MFEFLNKLKKEEKKDIDKAELAKQLFEFDTSSSYAKEVRKILKEYTKQGEQYPDRQDVFLKAIDIIGIPNTPKERRIVAVAYLWSRYPFNLKGIEYGELYLDNELCKESYSIWCLPKNIHDTIENKEKFEKSSFLHLIGEIYEKEYKLEEALICYKKQIELTPYLSNSYIDVAKVLVKQGKIDEALKILKETRKSEYYKPFSTKQYKWENEILNDNFKVSIEKNIKEIEEKKQKNYKYKAKPSKCKFTKIYYDNLSDLQKKYLEEYIKKGLVTIE